MKQHQAQQGKKTGVAIVVVPPAGKQEAPITFRSNWKARGLQLPRTPTKPTILYCTPPLRYPYTSLATNCLLQCSLVRCHAINFIPVPPWANGRADRLLGSRPHIIEACACIRLHHPELHYSPLLHPSNLTKPVCCHCAHSLAHSLLLLAAHLSFPATPPKTTLILNLSPNITPNTPIVAYYASDITRTAQQLLRDTIIPHFSFNDGLRRSL